MEIDNVHGQWMTIIICLRTFICIRACNNSLWALNWIEADRRLIRIEVFLDYSLFEIQIITRHATKIDFQIELY